VGKLKKVKAFIRLVRIEHAFFLAIAVAVGAIIAAKANPAVDFSIFDTEGNMLYVLYLLFIAMLSPFFIEMASFAINDYWDIETDKANKRKDRPLVTGELKKETALATAMLFFPLGIVLAFFTNITAFLLVLLFVVLSFYYSYEWKKKPVIGNIVIAASMAVPFIFGNVVIYNKIQLPVVILASMAFLMGLGREIFKSIQDIAGDRKQGRKTLPILIGKKNSAYIGSFLILLAVLISFYPLFFIEDYFGDIYYFSFVLITDILLVASVDSALKLKDFAAIREHTLKAQLTGLLAFLFGVLF